MLDEAYWNAPILGTPPAGLKPLEEREEEDFGFFDYAGDIAAAPFRGIAGAVEGIAEIGNIIPGVDYDIATNLGLGESETFVGGAVEGITEFATAFIPVAGWVGRGAKVAKMGKMAGGLEKAAKAKGAKGWAARRSQEAIAGGIADFAVIQGHEARLSDLIEQYPGLQNPVTEFLQSDEDDSEIVGRLKAAVEGIGAGIVFDSFLLGMKALRKGKQAFNDGVAEGLSEEAAGKNAVDAANGVYGTEEVSQVARSLNVSDEEAVGVLSLADAMGLDRNSIEFTKGSEATEGALDQAAFHGSPYRFEEFKLNKIGTGEGNQAYGWGLYFAENKGIAKDYKKTFAKSHKSDSKKIRENTATGYEVELDVADDQWLLWDRPLSGQAGVPKDLIGDSAGETGEQLYKRLVSSLGSPQKASEFLNERGVKGIKFYDGPSRNRPYKQIKKAFQDVLDDDAEVEEVLDLLESGKTFSPAETKFLRELEDNDWLGFDYPSQAISAALGKQLDNWYPSAGLKEAVEGLRSAVRTDHNFVVFDESVVTIKNLFQGEDLPKGQVAFQEDGRAVISGLKNPDFSTGAHELSHVARRRLFDRTVDPELRPGISDDDILTAEKWAGAKDGKWSVEAEEKFARGFENYLRTGKAPTKGLQGMFDKMAAWMREVYQSVTGSSIDIDISPEMREVFDKLVSRGDLPDLPGPRNMPASRLFQGAEDAAGDVGAVQARREELDVEGVVDVQTGRLNLRGVAGEPKKIIRAVEDALSNQIDAELGDMSDSELIADNLESLADMMGISPEQLSREIGSDRSNVRAVNRRVLTYKKTIETLTDDRLKPALDAVKQAQRDTGTVDAETLLRAEHELAAISEVITAMRGLRREQSQGLRIMKYSDVFFDVANAGDTADALARGRDALLEELGGREGLVKRIETITALLEQGGIDAAIKGLKKQRGNKYLLMLNEGFINNILSGPKTLTTNFMGPMLVSMYRPLENALGGLLTGDAKIVRRSMREFTGLFTSWNDALRMAKMALANDELVLDPSARQVDLPGNQRRAISAAGMDLSETSGVGKMFDVIGKIIGLPARALGGTDEFVKQLNYRAVVRADLTEQGIEKGLRGELLAEFIEKEMDNIVINGAALTARNLDREATKMGLSGAEKTKFISERIEASDPALAKRALDVAREVTFTRDLEADQSQFRKMSRTAQQLVNAHPGLRMFVPFIRTPVNLLSYAGERMVDPAISLVRMYNPISRTTPKEFKNLNGNRSRFLAELASEDPQLRAEAYGRGVAGLAFTVTGLALTANGNLTGGGPKDYKQRKLLEEAGWRPYSIKVGDDYYSYQRMDPFASMLGIFADMSDINRYAPPEMQAEVESIGLNMAIAVARNIGSKTYLQGVMDLAGLMENPERFVGTTTRKFAGAMVPMSGLLGQGVQAVGGDESMREIRTAIDAAQAKIPFLSSGLDPQRNFMGEASDRYMALGGRWTDWWLPIVHSTTSSDPINREIAALGHTFSPPSSNRYAEDLRSITGASGQSAYDRWLELHQEVRIGGRSLNQAMNRLIRSAAYRRMSAESFGDEKSPRVREIDKLIGRYRVKAEAQMLREFPQVNTAKKNKMVTRRALRTGQSTESIRASLFPLD